jgi:hypothetical protein
MPRPLTICLFLPLIVAGCDDGPKKPYDAGAGRGDQPNATTTVAAIPSHPVEGPSKPRVKLPCRAIAVGGNVKLFRSLDAMGAKNDSGTALALMDTLPVGSFVDLPEGGKVTVKSPLTSRETAFKGPARGMFCVDDEEKSWLLDGTFESSMGAGESPGSEEWVFSAFGVVRYSASNLTVHAGHHRLEVNVIGGSASLFVPTFASESPAPSVEAGNVAGDRWRRADPGFSVVLTPKEEKTEDRRAADVAGECATQAALTHKIALSLASHDLALATAANAHVLARREARALCGMAALWVTTLPASAKRNDLADKIAKANDEWQKID